MLDNAIAFEFIKTNLLFDFIKSIDKTYLIIPIIIYYLNDYLDVNMIRNLIFNIKYRRSFNYNEVMLSGDYTVKHTAFSSRGNCLFSDKFYALCDYINKNIEVSCIKEIENLQTNDYDDDDDERDEEISKKYFYIQTNNVPFNIIDDIHGYVKITLIDHDNKEGNRFKTETIQLTIFSYVKTQNQLINWINHITKNYNDKIAEKRNSKRFIFTLNNIDKDDGLQWNESEFTSSRTFDNMFIENKESILNEINFFSNNSDWYTRNGEPYNLGIGLKGSPGTGKTTFIKSLANKLKRHVVVIPLNRIKTEDDFFKAFFEKKYVSSNKSKIDFKDKIIVFEDIDCMDDIVLSRNNTNTSPSSKDAILPSCSELDTTALMVANALTNTTNDYKKYSANVTSEKITLSFILNILDGIIETYGRIIIISSNYYDKLDDALVRPGRIDMCVEFKKCTISMICYIYSYYYNEKLSKSQIKKLKDYKIAPCDIVNIKKKSYDNKDFFYKICEYMK